MVKKSIIKKSIKTALQLIFSIALPGGRNYRKE